MKAGILGGGQLGRMLALAGYPLGLQFRALDPAPDAPVHDLAEHVEGSYDDEAVLARFADGLDVVTYEFENIPVEAARFLASLVPLYPPYAALAASQDRFVEKSFMHGLGIPTPACVLVSTEQEMHAALANVGLPAVLKTRRLGYDGKGQAVIRTQEEVEPAWRNLQGSSLVCEAFVPFKRELSVLAVRGRTGETSFYPLVENVHRGGILRQSLAPAPGVTAELQAEAEGYATRVLNALEYVGVLAIELFEVEGRLVANEMAPRVHNSGHWTIEGAETSQFENHLRSICGLPLGSTAPRGRSAMLNIIGELPDIEAVLKVPGAHLHLYGKEPRPVRKLGHITLCRSSKTKLYEGLTQLHTLIPL